MIRNLIHTKFFRHASVLQAASFFQFGISFAASILIARILGPDQYGVYALAVALSGFFGLLLDVGQGSGSLVLFSRAYATEDAREFTRIGGFYIRTTAILYAAVGIPLFIGAGYIGDLVYHRGDLGLYVQLLLLTGLFTACFTFFTIILQIIRRVWILAIAEILNQLFTTTFIITGILLGFGVAGIFWGQLGAAVVSVALVFFIYRRYVRGAAVIPRIRSMVFSARTAAVKTYLKFSFPIALDKNIGELFNIGIMLLLGRMAAPADVGFFRIALSYISLSFFILGSVSRLLQDQFPKDQAASLGLLRSHFLKVSIFSGFISMGIGTLLVLVGPFLLQLVYGVKYAGASPLIRAFWWYAALIGFGVGLGSLYRTLGRINFAIKMNSAILVLGLPLCYVLVRYFGVVGAVYGFTLMRGSSTIIGFVRALPLLSEEHLRQERV